jgi:hypothetical protein
MEETKDQVENPEPEEQELSHADKLVGVFAEPAPTFSKMAKFPPRNKDWLFPVLLLIVVTILAQAVMMSNPVIRLSVMQKQLAKVEKNFKEMVDSGRLTQAQADQQMENVRERMEEGVGSNLIFTSIGIIVGTFIIFFIISGVFFLFARFVLKGDGTYNSSMVAYGLPFYLIVLQTVVRVILALVMVKFFSDTSAASFVDADTSTFGGMLLSKVDLFSIWFYVVLSFSYAKMFKSNNTGKYFAMIFGLWIGVSIIFFFLAQAIPFLRFFQM